MSEKIAELKMDVRSILNAAGKQGLTLRMIVSDYEEQCFQELDPHKFGQFTNHKGESYGSGRHF